ncbi:hypothetical protein ELU87_23500 [Escherichia coli]|nr:hypothetical protein [Escherichia coli]RWY90436.1 hypothetical protein EQH62_25080 [Escherichia coli]TFP81302.1 hypothetical protein ELU87_24250 [Escherichia coli]TFP82107.1 hypothetical protein ELU87_23500 [Escherichia coli]
MRCRPSLVRGRAAQVNPGGFTTPARRPSVPHRTAGCGKSSLRPLMAGSSPSLPDGSALLQIVGGDKLIIPFC